MSKEAMKLALEALEGLEALLLSMGLTHLIVYGDAEKAITALREALAEQPAQQEPFTHYRHYDNKLQDWADEKTIPLYTSPLAQRPWVVLTDEDKKTPDMGKYVFLNDDWIDGYKTGLEKAEAKLKEKNNGN